MYVSTQTQNPTQSNHMWASAGDGADEVIIDPRFHFFFFSFAFARFSRISAIIIFCCFGCKKIFLWIVMTLFVLDATISLFMVQLKLTMPYL